MDYTFSEVGFSLDFREEDAVVLGKHLKLRHSVELVGMKRVGISNFLRYFLYKKGIVEKYIDEKENHLFVTVDLNDLVEIEIFPFWILTFKRLVDRVNTAGIDQSLKKEVSALFLDAIQSQDLFLTVEALRKSLITLVKGGIFPTLFLLRFDRIGGVVNKQFFANLVGLYDATDQKLAYVFTSFRDLSEIAPMVFERKMLSTFSHPMYIKPEKRRDFEIIFKSLVSRYQLKVSDKLEQELWELCGGHVQYLHLAAIVLAKKDAKDGIFEVLSADERIKYLAEEIWESLTEIEQQVLAKVINGEKLAEADRQQGVYLWDCGIVGVNDKVFGKLFKDSLKKYQNGKTNGSDDKVEFTKKEHMLYNFLLEHVGEICEREAIIEAVWSEIEDLGVSDWTIDRLVARLRTKLKKQGSKYSVVTVKTRGYKLTE